VPFLKQEENRVAQTTGKASRLPPFLAGLLLGAALATLVPGTRAAIAAALAGGVTAAVMAAQ
jgi:hypothetical protein